MDRTDAMDERRVEPRANDTAVRAMKSDIAHVQAVSALAAFPGAYLCRQADAGFGQARFARPAAPRFRTCDSIHLLLNPVLPVHQGAL
jgi:hypothetical protein